ncbi:phosphate ABC transporter substrate-binding protein [Candidatus Sumerlaeota bacterium]|nr:phosphate ABC transporter substrate-binding protein [Candidatus Sumerlaeota bacterium]MBI3735228.1 phosphate ABC transporter substrate-binding protein [Candidatus Sumerlaeota bacterium]
MAFLGFGLAAHAAGKKKAGGEKELTGKITIKGSDTMVHLVTAWSEAYMDLHPGVAVNVTGGGSGTGISAIINGTTDICAASREMKAEEKAQVEQKGGKAVETVVARDGLALIVHPSNPVTVLTHEQLKKIYTGAAANWKDVGGADAKILALSRESSSGTYVFFQEHILSKQDYAPSVRLEPATAAIVQAATDDKTAIGYVGLGYASKAKGKVKILQIKAKDDSEPITPSEETVKSGKYTVARPLFLYVNEAKTSPVIKSFIDFCLSDAGQKIVTEEDYVTVK